MTLRPWRVVSILAMAGAGILLSSSVLSQSNSFHALSDEVTHLEWGGEHHRVEGVTPDGSVRLHYLKFDASQLEASIAIPANGIGHVQSVESMAESADAVVGINANFYDPSTNFPIGFMLDDGAILNTPYSDRATLAIEFFGRFHFLNPKINLQFTTSSGDFPIAGVNRSTYDHGLFLFTPEYGRPLPISFGATTLAIEEDRIIWIGSGTAPSYLTSNQNISWLIATGSAQSYVGDLLPAEFVEINYEMEPERFFIRDAIQAGPMLLNSSHISLLRSEGFSDEFIQARAARSAIGQTESDELILIVVTSGNGSVGMGLDQVAEYLRSLGAINAMAVDGGGSSSLVFRQGSIFRNVGGTREVPVGLLFSKK
jgi:hypothetical protein